MKKLLLLVASSIILAASAQSITTEQLISFANGYRISWNSKDKTGSFEEFVLKGLPVELSATGKFYGELLKQKNGLLTTEFLTLPDDQTLKYIWMVGEIYNGGENLTQMNSIADSLANNPLTRPELVENYYSKLFGKTINGQKFDLSKVNFVLEDFKFKEASDKAIFFLVCMNYCGKYIWGYINIAQPMNTKEALKLIKKYPMFNGKKYYLFTELTFPDFDFQLETDNPKTSFKSYYIHKYIEVLLSHLRCLKEEGGKEADMDDIFNNSSLKNESLYDFTTYKETLESIYLNRN